MNLSEARKQVVLALAHLPGRYGRMMGLPAGAPADRRTLDRFARTWFGPSAVELDDEIDDMVDEGLLEQDDGSFFLTERGRALRAALDRDGALHRYEYDVFYARATASRAHADLCRRVYGADLCQHGLADVAQLSLLIDELALTSDDRVLDVGCGAGRGTAWLAERSGARFVGIDLSQRGVEAARALPLAASDRLSFEVANMNALALAPASFDAIVSVDTLYYAADPEGTLRALAAALRPGGRMGILYSHFSDEDDDPSLSPERGALGALLTALGLPFRTVELTREEIAHWSTKRDALRAMRQDFLDEGSEALWAYRAAEAERYAAWRPSRRARFLYVVGG